MNGPAYHPERQKFCVLCENPLIQNSFIFFHQIAGKVVEFFHEACFAKHNPSVAQRMRQ